MADDKQTTQTATEPQPQVRVPVTGKDAETLAKAYLEKGETKPGHFYTLRTRGGVTGVEIERIG